MNYSKMKKAEIIEELKKLREQVEQLHQADAGHKSIEDNQ